MADLINKDKRLNEKLILLDHHKTALWLNEYSWAEVKTHQSDVQDSSKLTSGTMLFYDYLAREGLTEPSFSIERFVNEDVVKYF